MNLNISNSSGQPIYDQICEQIKAMILTGQLGEGDALPSMRLLAKELREEHLKRIEQLLDEAVRLARLAGISDAELAEMLTLQLEEEQK